MLKQLNCMMIGKGLLVFVLMLFLSLQLSSQISSSVNSTIPDNDNKSCDSPVRSAYSKVENSETAGLVCNKELKAFDVIKSLSIKIVESQSYNVLHDMDQTWLSVCQNMGHTASIEPQTLLDNTDFFSNTDVLVISSGVITMPDNRRDIIQQYVEQGGPVYFQSEYDKNLTANQAFETIVNNLGGSFSWGVTISGELTPMNVTGVLSAVPNNIPTLNYFWYGSVGTGDNTLEPFLEYSGNQYGFIFTPPNNNYGSMISISDQDWAIQSAEKMYLMENIIAYLSSTLTANDEIQSLEFNLRQNSPNPFNSSTAISFSINYHGNVKISVFNMLGNEIQILADEPMSTGSFTFTFNGDNLPGGIYFCTLQLGNKIVATRKMNLIK